MSPVSKVEPSSVSKLCKMFDEDCHCMTVKHIRVLCVSRRRGNKSRIYDDRGIRLADNRDVCDCLNIDCPGCHMPCPRCSSGKCGAECRANRNWFYAEVEIEGGPRTKVVAEQLSQPAELSQLARRITKCQL